MYARPGMMPGGYGPGVTMNTMQRRYMGGGYPAGAASNPMLMPRGHMPNSLGYGGSGPGMLQQHGVAPPHQSMSSFDENGNPITTATLPMMPHRGGPAALPRPETDDERSMRLMQERHAITGQAFAVLGQLLQLGAAIASGGQQLLSIVVGTTFAVRTAQYLLTGGSPTALVTGGPIVGSPQMTGNGLAKSLVTSSSSTAEGATAAPAKAHPIMRALRSPATMILLIGAIVAAEHLYKLWQARRARQQLEADERQLILMGAAPFADAADPSQATLAAEQQPSAPIASEPPSASIYVARFAYEAAADNQLTINVGDQLIITQFDPSGWSWATLTSVSRRGTSAEASALSRTEGYIPGNYVEPVLVRQRRL